MKKNKLKWISTALIFMFCFVAASLCLKVDPANGEWYQHEGKGYVICDAILKRLNSYKSKTEQEAKECSWNVVASYPGFKEPPWQDLDPKKYEDLIFKLLKYRVCGVDGYFGKGPCNLSDTDEYLHKETRRFIEEGGRLQLWRARLLDWYDITEGRQAPTGPQTIVQLRWIRDMVPEKKSCPGKPVVDWWMGGLYFMTDDLSGPNPEVPNQSAFRFKYETVFIYSGKKHYVDGNEGASIAIDRDGWPVTFCDIRYK